MDFARVNMFSILLYFEIKFVTNIFRARDDHYYSFRCEIRAGPKYIIRKYSFFKNDTFLLLQYHYDEESCSIAAYTVIARGSVKILSPSIAIPGAAETNVQLDSVYLIPFNRQVDRSMFRCYQNCYAKLNKLIITTN